METTPMETTTIASSTTKFGYPVLEIIMMTAQVH
jgi:hypothetical protein